MGKFDTYKIPLRTMPHGVHTFEMHLTRKFFADIDGEEVQKGDVEVRLEVTKSEHSFQFQFQLEGVVQVSCDRCLDDVEIPIDSAEKLTVKYGEEFKDEGDDIIIVPEGEEELNVAWYIYEFVALALPIKKVHAPGKCNKGMSATLRRHTAHKADEETEDLSLAELDFDEAQSTPIDNDPSTDPRWDSLKKLID